MIRFLTLLRDDGESLCCKFSVSLWQLEKEKMEPNLYLTSDLSPQVPMPSYLIAIVVGALESRYGLSHLFTDVIMLPGAGKQCLFSLAHREIGPRSRVWSEKEFVDKAAFEFSEVRHSRHTGFTGPSSSETGNINDVSWSRFIRPVCPATSFSWRRLSRSLTGLMFLCQTETMLKTAEDLAGPYVWGQYDILVLPPSFPYGGMENPCLTFATPTLLVRIHVVQTLWLRQNQINQLWCDLWSAVSCVFSGRR